MRDRHILILKLSIATGIILSFMILFGYIIMDFTAGSLLGGLNPTRFSVLKDLKVILLVSGLSLSWLYAYRSIEFEGEEITCSPLTMYFVAVFCIVPSTLFLFGFILLVAGGNIATGQIVISQLIIVLLLAIIGAAVAAWILSKRLLDKDIFKAMTSRLKIGIVILLIGLTAIIAFAWESLGSYVFSAMLFTALIFQIFKLQILGLFVPIILGILGIILGIISAGLLAGCAKSISSIALKLSMAVLVAGLLLIPVSLLAGSGLFAELIYFINVKASVGETMLFLPLPEEISSLSVNGGGSYEIIEIDSPTGNTKVKALKVVTNNEISLSASKDYQVKPDFGGGFPTQFNLIEGDSALVYSSGNNTELTISIRVSFRNIAEYRGSANLNAGWQKIRLESRRTMVD